MGSTTIATFNTQSEAARSLRAVDKVSFSLEDAQELAASEDKKTNAVSLVTSSDSCPAECRTALPDVLLSGRAQAISTRCISKSIWHRTEFSKLVNEEVENNAATDKAPSTHTSPVVPVTTAGNKTGSERVLRVG